MKISSKIFKNLVSKYIEKENTIILAISPANADIANSEGISIAREYDSERERTFGVITKIDMMSKESDARKDILGQNYSLAHGYIAVKLRSEEDNRNGKSIQDAIEDEKKFFQNHKAYRDILDRWGVPTLGKKLSILLRNHITKCLPSIESKLEEKYNLEKKNLE